MADQSVKNLNLKDTPLRITQISNLQHQNLVSNGNSQLNSNSCISQSLKDKLILKEKTINQRYESQIETHHVKQSNEKDNLDQDLEQNEADFTEYVNIFQNQENQRLNTTLEAYEENKTGQIHLQFDLGSNKVQNEEQMVGSKGFKAKKQPILIKNMKKWRIKQSLKNKSLSQDEQTFSQQCLKSQQDSKKQINYVQPNKQNLNLCFKQSTGESQDQNLSKFINKIESYQKNNNAHKKGQKIDQEYAEKSISAIDTSKEDSMLFQNDKNNSISEIENGQQKQEILSTLKYTEQLKPQAQNLSTKILVSQQINQNPNQFTNKKLSLDTNLTRKQSIKIIQKNQYNKTPCNSTLRNTDHILQHSAQSEANTSNKDNRSQSLNNKLSKKRNISIQMFSNNNNLKVNQSQSAAQEYLQNYLNTADTNHLLLSNLNKGVILLPPQAQQTDNIFIPKVMTRNASYLKKGNNPTENVCNFQNSSYQFSKQIDVKFMSNKINCKENASVPLSPSRNKLSNEIFQFNPTNNSQRSQQSSQSNSFQKSLKSYLFYQNKFLGQKQHEFLKNNFKCLPKLNKLLNQQQNNVHNESNNYTQNNLNKVLTQNLTESKSEQFISNKQNEQLQHQLQQDVSPKRVLVCSFTNQYSCHQLQKHKLNELKQQEATIEKDTTKQNENFYKQIPQETQKLNFNELSNYYKQKYEQEVINKNENSVSQSNNYKSQKLNYLLQNGILRKKYQSQDLRHLYYENEETKMSEIFKSQKQQNEEEIDLLKPWNVY